MDLAAPCNASPRRSCCAWRGTRAERTSQNLCMAGGVALNCVANGRILREGPFDNVWIQPAAGDAGGAIGVAMDVCFRMGNDVARKTGNGDAMKGAYLGPSYDMPAVRAALTRRGGVFRELSDDDLIETVATALTQDKVVGWFQGRMEFGPRALGNRSILGDARSPTMQRMLNMKVKYRESFRPFAPIVLREDVSEYFELDRDSPYMLLVAPVREDRRFGSRRSRRRPSAWIS